MSRLSMDLKVMPMSTKGHKIILVIIDEVTNYLTCVMRNFTRSEEMGEILIENLIKSIQLLRYNDNEST